MKRKELWQKVGYISSGDAIYRSELGFFAIEKDHEFLVKPTYQEFEELKSGKDDEIYVTNHTYREFCK